MIANGGHFNARSSAPIIACIRPQSNGGAPLGSPVPMIPGPRIQTIRVGAPQRHRSRRGTARQALRSSMVTGAGHDCTPAARAEVTGKPARREHNRRLQPDARSHRRVIVVGPRLHRHRTRLGCDGFLLLPARAAGNAGSRVLAGLVGIRAKRIVSRGRSRVGIRAKGIVSRVGRGHAEAASALNRGPRRCLDHLARRGRHAVVITPSLGINTRSAAKQIESQKCTRFLVVSHGTVDLGQPSRESRTASRAKLWRPRRPGNALHYARPHRKDKGGARNSKRSQSEARWATIAASGLSPRSDREQPPPAE